MPFEPFDIPDDVRAFIREAERRIERFQIDHHVPAFVPSDFATMYRALSTLSAANLTEGRLFCEWGSGFGVVTCLAAMLDFDAFGIEIEERLVDAAQQLAAQFDLSAEFVSGSFIPSDAEVYLEKTNGFAWLTTDSGDAYEHLELEPDDFDVIFAYPWPDEEDVVADLFHRHAQSGAILMTNHENGQIRVRRKVRSRRR